MAVCTVITPQRWDEKRIISNVLTVCIKTFPIDHDQHLSALLIEFYTVCPKIPQLIHQSNNLDTFSDGTDLLTLTLSHINTDTHTHTCVAQEAARCTEHVTVSDSEMGTTRNKMDNMLISLWEQVLLRDTSLINQNLTMNSRLWWS